MAIFAASFVAGCTPDFGDTTSLVTEPRLLAAQGAPAEGATGSAFTVRALYVGPNGPADAGSIRWSTCLLQNPLGNPGSVNPACFADASAGLVPLGTGGVVNGVIPVNACELFGPESPPPAAGLPAARPTDPDSTGGYYLPIRVETGDLPDSVVSERIACQPSRVTESVFTAFTMGYIPNENPVISSLSRVMSSSANSVVAPDMPGGKARLAVPVGVSESLEVMWPPCPATPAACGGAETFLLIDPSTTEVVTARESMVTSWYASGGTFTQDRVGISESDTTTQVVNTWVAPTAPGTVHLWVVLRDSRGGVGWESYTIDVIQ
jgi:hypothetical protein